MPRTRKYKYYRLTRTRHKKEYIQGRATDIIRSALCVFRNVFVFEINRMSISDVDATIEQVRDKGLFYIARANNGVFVGMENGELIRECHSIPASFLINKAVFFTNLTEDEAVKLVEEINTIGRIRPYDEPNKDIKVKAGPIQLPENHRKIIWRRYRSIADESKIKDGTEEQSLEEKAVYLRALWLKCEVRDESIVVLQDRVICQRNKLLTPKACGILNALSLRAEVGINYKLKFCRLFDVDPEMDE